LGDFMYTDIYQDDFIWGCDLSGEYLIGLDLGTTNIKGIIMTTGGKTVGETSLPVSYNIGSEGKVEYCGEDFFINVAKLIKKLVENIEGDVKGISMVSASGNTILLNGNNRPIRPIISWLDKRFTDEAESIFVNPYNYYDIIGWPFNNTFPLAHLSWLKLNEPENYDSANKICMVTDYVNYRLTGCLATNPSTATTFYLQDQENACWYSDILSKLNIDEVQLPEIISSGEIIGHINEESATLTGLRLGTPVIAGSFDHPGAARGTGVLKDGDLLLSCGTSWVGFYPCENRKKLISLGMLVDPFLKDGPYAGMFSLPRIGNHIDSIIKKWISPSEDRYKLFNDYAAAGQKGLSLNPMIDSDRDFGGYSKEQISLALMEGTALLMKEKIDFYAKNGLKIENIVIAGGPTRSELWLSILGDILKNEINAAGSHAGAKGAAIMAGIGYGIYIDEFDVLKKGVCDGTI